MKTQKKRIYFEKMKHLMNFMTTSNSELMRDEEVIFDSLIACIMTAVELEGKGTRQYMYSISYLAWVSLFL